MQALAVFQIIRNADTRQSIQNTKNLSLTPVETGRQKGAKVLYASYPRARVFRDLSVILAYSDELAAYAEFAACKEISRVNTVNVCLLDLHSLLSA